MCSGRAPGHLCARRRLVSAGSGLCSKRGVGRAGGALLAREVGSWATQLVVRGAAPLRRARAASTHRGARRVRCAGTETGGGKLEAGATQTHPKHSRHPASPQPHTQPDHLCLSQRAHSPPGQTRFLRRLLRRLLAREALAPRLLRISQLLLRLRHHLEGGGIIAGARQYVGVARPLPQRTPPPRTPRVDMTHMRCTERVRRAWRAAERLLFCSARSTRSHPGAPS
jgi:hypothetical protein